MPVELGTFQRMAWATSLMGIPPQSKLLAIYFAEVGFNFSIAKASDWTGIPTDQITLFLSRIPRTDFLEVPRLADRAIVVTWPVV